MGTLQVSFWTVGSVVKHQGPSGLLFGFRQKFSWRMLFGSEALNSLQVSRRDKQGLSDGPDHGQGPCPGLREDHIKTDSL